MTVRAKITGTGMYVPENVVTNDDLAKVMDTTDEWIRQRSGIVERRYIVDGQQPSELAEHASRAALDAAGIDADEIEALPQQQSAQPFLHRQICLCQHTAIHLVLSCNTRKTRQQLGFRRRYYIVLHIIYRIRHTIHTC